MSIIRNPKADQGKLVPIENNNKKVNENENYYALWIEDKDESNERCLILSDGDLKLIKEVKYSDFANVMQLGMLYRMGNSSSYFIKIMTIDKVQKVVKLTKTTIKNGLDRAKRNKEDVPQKGIIQNFFD